MNLKALITTFVLGSSTMASADSLSVSGSVRVSLDHHTVTRSAPAPLIVRGYRTPDPCTTAPAPAPVYQPAAWTGFHPHNTQMDRNMSVYVGALSFHMSRYQGWFDLTEATRIDGPGNIELFNLNGRGKFRALQLQALGIGGSKINNVLVVFTDGSKQNIVVKQQLDRNNPFITIDLAGNYRSIKQIQVHGATERGAAYKILAK